MNATANRSLDLAAVREQLRQLERRGRLEKHLVEHVAMPWTDIAHVLQYPAWFGAGIAIVVLAGRRSDGEAITAVDVAWICALVAIAYVLRFGWRWMGTASERLRRRVRRQGLLVPAAIVQANEAFFAEDNTAWLPASLLVSFDPAVVPEPGRLEQAARTVGLLRTADRRALPAEQAELAWTLYHEMVPVASAPVPESLAGLRDCWLVSAELPPRPLQVGALCLVLAVPNERSHHAVAVLPARIVDPCV